MNDRQVLYTSGPIARSVDDAAAMLDVMAGVSRGRPHWAPPPPRPFAELAKLPPQRLVVRFGTKAPIGRTDPEIADVVVKTARVLAELGHDVEETELPEGNAEEFLPLWQHLVAQMPILPWRYDRLQDMTRWLAERGRSLRADDVRARQAAIDSRVAAALDQADLWLTPTVPKPAPPVGVFAGHQPPAIFEAAAELASFTAAFNVTGRPAASLPLGVTSAGLPIGVQLGGRLFADAEVLAVSRQLEEALPWRHRVAPELSPEIEGWPLRQS